MEPSALTQLARELEEMGMVAPFHGDICAIEIAAAAQTLVGRCRRALAGDPDMWPAERHVVAAYQLILTDTGLHPGPIDGLWTTDTARAHAAFAQRRGARARPQRP